MPLQISHAFRIQILTEDGVEPAAGIGGFEDQALHLPQGVIQGRRLTTPPGGDGGHAQRLAQQMLAQARQKAQQRRGLQDAGTQAVGDQHRTATGAFGQTGNAERRVGAQFKGIAEGIVLPPHDAVHPAQTAQGLEPDAPLAHRQIAPLHQWKAQITRQQGVLEIGFVEGPGGEQHHQRRAVTARCIVQQ